MREKRDQNRENVCICREILPLNVMKLKNDKEHNNCDRTK